MNQKNIIFAVMMLFLLTMESALGQQKENLKLWYDAPASRLE
ncbi:hypothetical protein OEG92_07270 [Polaribacter sejongensis]